MTRARFAVMVVLCVAACRSREASRGSTRDDDPPPEPQSAVKRVAIPSHEAVILALGCPNGVDGVRQDLIEIRQMIPGFHIDEVTTSCARFRACAAAGACKGSDAPDCTDGGVCCKGAAVVTIFQAAMYCAWQGARLPSYAQWQRAVRGTTGRKFPHPMGDTWDAARACDTPTWPPMHRCLHRSDDGVEYATRNYNFGEWTRDFDCSPVGGEHMAPVTVDLAGNRLDGNNVLGTRAEFRCVTE